MTTYSWPANLAQSKAGWVTSLIDWPEIAAVGADAQTSVLTAAKDLSEAVRHRLAQGSVIPLPSELKPGQIQIPVDADAAARLDTYVEQQQEKRLKRLSEIEEANRAKRASFLTEFRVNLDSIESLRNQVDQASVDFALLAVKSAYVLNGGALVAIPAILQLSTSGAVPGPHLLSAVIFFVLGILLAAVTNYLAYRSLSHSSDGHQQEAKARADEVSIAYYPPEDPSSKQAAIQQARADANVLYSKSRRLADIGVAAFGLSVLAFLTGVAVIVYALATPPAA